MKRSVKQRMLSLLLALLCVVGILASCRKEPEDDGFAHIIEEGASQYLLVSGSKDKAGWDAAHYLADKLEEKTGVAIKVVDDRTERSSAVPEIRVGKTNRGTDYALQRAVRVDEYIISREEKDIYILGMGAEVLTAACDAFIEQILGDDYCITESGELHRKSGTYTANSFKLNGRNVTEYTLLTAESGAVDWSQGLPAATEKLTEITGHIMPTGTYDPKSSTLPYSPAIVLCGDAGTLGMTEFKVEIRGEDIYVTAGATAAALKILNDFVEGKLSTAQGEFSLMVAGKTGETGQTSAAFSVMSFNVLGDKTLWGDLTDRNPNITATILNSMPDFVCTQEYYSTHADKSVTAALAEAGYGKLGGTFTCISPTAVENKDTDEEWDTYAQVGKYCNTPIFYRSELWEPVEEDCAAYLFYWKNRYQYTNTKSMVYGVFRSKIDGQLVLVVSTHFPLMTSSYTSKPEYATATDAVEGAQWRNGATAEILKAVNAMREKYPGILTVVAGDMNAKSTEASMQTMTGDDTILEDAYDLAPENARTGGASFHGKNSNAPSAKGSPIDHIFVSNDTALVLSHQIIQDATALNASDHCPVLAEIYRK